MWRWARRTSAQSNAGPETGPGLGSSVGLQHNVKLAMRALSPYVEFRFGLDRRSLVWVEGFLERQRTDPNVDADRLVPVLGSFLGQCLVEHGPGTWLERDEGWCVHCPRVDAFPFAKTEKQARNGLAGGDSIVNSYDNILAEASRPFPPTSTAGE